MIYARLPISMSTPKIAKNTAAQGLFRHSLAIALLSAGMKTISAHTPIAIIKYQTMKVIMERKATSAIVGKQCFSHITGM